MNTAIKNNTDISGLRAVITNIADNTEVNVNKSNNILFIFFYLELPFKGIGELIIKSITKIYKS